MKAKLNYVVFAVFAILFATGLHSCRLDATSIRGSGNIITKTRNFDESFSRVHVSSGLSATIEQSDSQSVIIEADDNVIDQIKTSVEDGTLKIWSDLNSFTNVTKKITVRIPAIHELRASGGADITSTQTLSSDEISLDASSGSNIDVSVEADQVICETSSGSTLSVNGKALSVRASSSSGSTLDASKLLANEVHAESSSGSSTDVHAIVSLQADASSGSSITYSGTPTVNSDTSSGGSVSPR